MFKDQFSLLLSLRYSITDLLTEGKHTSRFDFWNEKRKNSLKSNNKMMMKKEHNDEDEDEGLLRPLNEDINQGSATDQDESRDQEKKDPISRTNGLLKRKGIHMPLECIPLFSVEVLIRDEYFLSSSRSSNSLFHLPLLPLLLLLLLNLLLSVLNFLTTVKILFLSYEESDARKRIQVLNAKGEKKPKREEK